MKTNKFSVNLFCSLMLLSLIPFLYTIVRTNLIANSPSTDGLGIAGHLEWFDLINETIQAFLIVPLYALLNRCVHHKDLLRQRIFQAFLIVNGIYIVFAIFIFMRCNAMVRSMASGRIQEVTGYLQLETIGFMIANVVCFVHILFVVLEKTNYIYAMVLLKTVCTVIGDLFLIPRFGVNGAAYSNIAVNAVCVFLCAIAVYRNKLMAVSFQFGRSFPKEYLIIGLFSGSQILLDNVIYSTIVCKMVNVVEEQGNYWTANNIIWGLLLIPISALAEIIRKDCRDAVTPAQMKRYHVVLLATFLAWLCLIPMLNPFLKNVMGIENFAAIKHILLLLMPFYLAYGYTVLFDNILIGNGKTAYCFAISAIVNLVYYPIVYGLAATGIVTPGITFICMMFGFGMVTHLGCSIVCFMIHRKRTKDGH